MLQVNFLRENKERVLEGLKKRSFKELDLVDAAINAVKSITKRRVHLEEYLVQAITRGSDDLGKVHVQVSHKGKMYHGFGANTDIVTASVESFLDAIAKIS